MKPCGPPASRRVGPGPARDKEGKPMNDLIRADLFWAKVEKTQDCWEWMASIDHRGYGKFAVGRRILGAHRVAWELHHGAIPDGLFVCHRCDNPRCVRPVHLFLGTAADNSRDMCAKGRVQSGAQHHTQRQPDRVARGEQGSNARLTWEQVHEIRARYGAGGARLQDLADEYGVNFGTIGKIVRGDRWKE